MLRQAHTHSHTHLKTHTPYSNRMECNASIKPSIKSNPIIFQKEELKQRFSLTKIRTNKLNEPHKSNQSANNLCGSWTTLIKGGTQAVKATCDLCVRGRV